MATAARTPAYAELTRLLREAIMDSEFVPHQRLIESDLMERFGAGRGPVRTALLKLSEEGLVELLPNRGARVRAITIEEAIELIEVRMVLEALCARRAAERATKEDISKLTALRGKIEDSFNAGDKETYDLRHREMDRIIRDISGHATAKHMIERLRAQAARHQFQASRSLPGDKFSIGEHLAIIDGVIAKDPERAAAATVAHLERVAESLRNLR